MPQFGEMKLKDTHPLAQQFQRLMSDQPAQPYGYDALTEEEKSGLSMQRLFMTEEERMQSIQQEQLEAEEQKKRLLKEEWGQFGMQLAKVRMQWEQDQFHYQKVELAKNKNDKTLAKLKTPEEIEELREKRKQKAIEADKRKVFNDKTRHGFYKCVGAFVKFGRWISGADKEERETAENPTYEVPGLLAEYERMKKLKPDEADPDYQGVPGDLNDDGEVTDADAIYLLYATFDPDSYPLYRNADFNGDGEVTDADALYLLYATLDPDGYPLS